MILNTQIPFPSNIPTNPYSLAFTSNPLANTYIRNHFSNFIIHDCLHIDRLKTIFTRVRNFVAILHTQTACFNHGEHSSMIYTCMAMTKKMLKEHLQFKLINIDVEEGGCKVGAMQSVNAQW